ncbi:hypothetical protein Glove_91g151 [Diversispora epigaea]|uniref:Inner centromere protein ARK-binding domain-containing protein n=1 Tax=Diversispora epigaea TaxID=1348612 RepID=A0A397JEA5_9GLOM|nr:hypothetical protein Glove_91g151 [Diversispora epigaea]
MEVDEKNPYPDWAKSENLSKSLKTQQKIDPEIIFGKPEGLNIKKDDFGDDVLTEGEVKAYNEKMGYEY